MQRLLVVSPFFPMLQIFFAGTVISQIQAAAPTEGYIGGVSLTGGVSIPLASFAETTVPKNDGYARIGYSLSSEYDLPMEGGPFFEFATLNFTSNSMDKSKLLQSLNAPEGFQINVGSYSSLVPMVGVGVQSQLRPRNRGYVEAQAGMMFSWIPALTLSGPNGNQLSNSSSAHGSAFAFGASAGLEISNRYIVSLRYISATPSYTGTVSNPNTGETIYTSGTQTISMLLVQIGVRLF